MIPGQYWRDCLARRILILAVRLNSKKNVGEVDYQLPSGKVETTTIHGVNSFEGWSPEAPDEYTPVRIKALAQGWTWIEP